MIKRTNKKTTCKQFGTTERTIARRENGETDMYLSTAVKLAEFYKVSIDVLVNGSVKDE
ncbi:helix-turn-helix domain-containing protein [Streptococcus salivarius]|uniref:helix-turn-helix domain-containing protein n=1 Tax=Streptococcus salivarius TaxID=1304 RepID=UPI0034D56D0D